MIGIIDANIGNLKSVCNAIDSLGFDYTRVTSGSDFRDISHLIIPGVGSFPGAMAEIESRDLTAPIRKFAASGKPVLGICLGMQVLAEYGEEGERTEGLALIPGHVDRIPERDGLRIPHVGWNSVRGARPHPVLRGVKDDRDFYFVHSYIFSAAEQNVLRTTDYGAPFPSIVGDKNVVGFQFHPEKSQNNGLKLLENFCLWDGAC